MCVRDLQERKASQKARWLFGPLGHRRAWGLVGMAFLAILLCQAPILSQSITGDILGTIRDTSSAVVPGAEITLTAVETGTVLKTVSDGAGNYTFAQLKPGHYRLEVSNGGGSARRRFGTLSS